jgi:nucleoside-diphosphate-sugar epimerase
MGPFLVRIRICVLQLFNFEQLRRLLPLPPSLSLNMVLGSLLGSLSPSKPRSEGVPGFQSSPGAVCLVTGSSGLCGARLVEMLLERGAATVICFDLAAPDAVLQKRFQDVQDQTKGKLIMFSGKDGDLTNKEAVEKSFQAVDKIDICYHIAALVGPFHDRDLYMKVNYDGTMNIIEACKKYKVRKLVNSSSPSTRFTGADIEGLREDELPIPDKFLALYAETKAYAEKEVAKACSEELRTVSVAPHQVYGPYDSLFMPSLLETSGNGRLRIFGKGDNKISVCYVDNYCHGLMCGADALYQDSPALGKFYIVTDEDPQYFWKIINQAGMAMGFEDLEAKFHLPVPFLYAVAYFCNVLGWIIGKKFKLNPFNVRMLTIHRYFSIDNAKRDLKYVPQYEFESAWQSTIDWFKMNWLPGYLEKTGRAVSDTKKED